ncbi:condensation domain-containing protein [Lentzea sp. NPDC034063]|uniref:condensation domain-containing protein n=1 Tax=unclassified Lentzea TaxID=2643253 RepID=UPI0033BFE94D
MSDIANRIGELTPAQLAALHARLRDRASTRPEQDAIPRLEERSAPLSFAQERLWFMDRMSPGNVAYNLTEAIQLTGELDAGALEQAFAAVVESQQALRTVFREQDGRGVQIVEPTTSWSMRFLDLADRPESEHGEAVRSLVANEEEHPFDLEHGPLLRTLVVKLGERAHVLILTLHHIIADGWSFGVLIEGLSTAYNGLVAGEAVPLPDPAIQYADFAAWQRDRLTGPRLDALREHWRDRLAGVPNTLELRGARPRPARQSFRGDHQDFVVPNEVADELRKLSRASNTTMFMTLTAVFAVLLAHHSDQRDFAIGTDIANRTRRETNGLVGLFVNQLVLRADLSGDPSFADVLAQVRRTTLDAFDHQDLPFQALVADLAPRRSLDRNPLFQVLLVLQEPVLDRTRLQGIAVRPVTLAAGTRSTAFDLSVHLTETRQGLEGALRYSTDLFPEQMIRELAADFTFLLGEVALRQGATLGALSAALHSARAARLSERTVEARAAAGRILRSVKRKAMGDSEGERS